MGDGSGIEWTDATWNVTVGCTKVSPGCDHCYAETFVNRFAGSKGFPLPFDEMHVRGDRFLSLPLTKWREPRRVFVNSLSDLFHDDVSEAVIADVFAVMAVAQQHTFQLLTKRHGRMRSLLSSRRFGELCVAALRGLRDRKLITSPQYLDAADVGGLDRVPLPNLWVGVSVEDQKWADVRIPALLATPAAVRWISAEPLLGPVDLRFIGSTTELTGQQLNDGGAEASYVVRTDRLLDWVVVGGESGAGARPMHPAWVRSLRDQCARADVPFVYKQWGNYAPVSGEPSRSDVWVLADGGTRPYDGEWDGDSSIEHDDVNGYGDALMRNVGKKAAGRLLDGRTYDGYPTPVSVSG